MSFLSLFISVDFSTFSSATLLSFVISSFRFFFFFVERLRGEVGQECLELLLEDLFIALTILKKFLKRNGVIY